MEAVSFPVVESAVIAFLNAQFQARSEMARAGSKVPDARGPFVRVSRIGGTRTLSHDQAMVTFECWDTTNPSAARLGTLTRALIGSMDTGVVRYAGEVGGLAFFPDPLSDDPRYQFTAFIRSRGEAI